MQPWWPSQGGRSVPRVMIAMAQKLLRLDTRPPAQRHTRHCVDSHVEELEFQKTISQLILLPLFSECQNIVPTVDTASY